MAPAKKGRTLGVPVKPRKSHRKSRHGCRVCKRRHMKCDETRPACGNCTISGRQCFYADPSPQPPSGKPADAAFSDTASPAGGQFPLSSSVTTPASTPSLVQSGIESHVPPDVVLEGAVVFHFEDFALFYYVQTNIKTFLLPGMFTDSMTKSIFESSLTAPYLLEQLLALAALYLSKQYPEQPDYLQRATNLQTRALSSFNRAKQQVSDETCVPMFLFSSLLGLHVLCDTLQTQRDSFSSFLDRFTKYFHLHRGVSAITGQSWRAIKESYLGSFLAEIEDAFNRDAYYQGEVDILYKMVDEAHLSEFHCRTYRQTLETLEVAFTLYHGLVARGKLPYDAPLAFSIKIPSQFITCLEQRQPEALVVLAFYAVMLYWSRNFWVFNDGGEYLIEEIGAFLGPHWAKWMSWPMSVLQSRTSQTDPSLLQPGQANQYSSIV